LSIRLAIAGLSGWPGAEKGEGGGGGVGANCGVLAQAERSVARRRRAANWKGYLIPHVLPQGHPERSKGSPAALRVARSFVAMLLRTTR
jgi:hypothetical protein